jgi:hypothetical protein
VFWGFGKDEILLEMKKRERERKVRRVKARKRVGFEHGRVVVVVVFGVGGGILVSEFCFVL